MDLDRAFGADFEEYRNQDVENAVILYLYRSEIKIRSSVFSGDEKYGILALLSADAFCGQNIDII